MAESEPVVTNSGPLSALASVGHLNLLSALYTSVLVPEAVRNPFVTFTVSLRVRC